MGETLSVGLGEIVVSEDQDDVLVAYGLGSCLGIACYDKDAIIAGMLHAVLPEPNGNANNVDARYVVQGVPLLIDQVINAGATRSKLTIRIAGGANMLNSPGFQNVLNIGKRNIAAAEAVLEKTSIPVVGRDVGGNTGRTVRFYVRDGRMMIRRLGGEEIEL